MSAGSFLNSNLMRPRSHGNVATFSNGVILVTLFISHFVSLNGCYPLKYIIHIVNSLSGISEWQDYDQKLSDIATATLDQVNNI